MHVLCPLCLLPTCLRVARTHLPEGRRRYEHDTSTHMSHVRRIRRWNHRGSIEAELGDVKEIASEVAMDVRAVDEEEESSDEEDDE